MLGLTLGSGHNRVSCRAIVDSGADYCLFPRSFMPLLGLDASTTPIEKTSGVGSANVHTHFSKAIIDLPGVARVEVYAGFTIGMDHHGFGLLGQQGFFETFRITFDLARRMFYLEKR